MNDCKDYLISHRHEGWEGPAEACPICRAHDAKRKAEEQELKAAAEADYYKAQLQDARAVIQAVVDAIQPLAPFLLAHARWDKPEDNPDE